MRRPMKNLRILPSFLHLCVTLAPGGHASPWSPVPTEQPADEKSPDFSGQGVAMTALPQSLAASSAHHARPRS
jgi:hypothetical protein